MREEKIKVDLYAKSPMSVPLNQYDTTKLTVYIYDHQQPYNLDGVQFVFTGIINGAAKIIQTAGMTASENMLNIALAPEFVAEYGDLQLQLKLFDTSGSLISSFIFHATVEQSLDSINVPDAPDADDTAQRLYLSTKAPYINDASKNWMQFDEATGDFVDTGIRAQGTSGGGGNRDIIEITADRWTELDGRYIITLTPSSHSLGLMAYVSEVERKNGGSYENIFFGYDRQPNGSITITSDEVFDGRIILEE